MRQGSKQVWRALISLLLVVFLIVFLLLGLSPVVANASSVGESASNRPSNAPHGNTMLNLGNPATASFIVTTVEMWFDVADATGVRVGSFYGSDNTWTCRDSEYIGTVVSGSLQSKTVTVTFEIGDVIGIYVEDNGHLERSESGSSGVRYIAGELIDINDTSTSWLSLAGRALSLYGYPTSIVTPSVNISVTALGQESDNLDITNTPDSYAFGFVHANDIEDTGLDNFTVTNDGNVNLDISIYGEDLTGLGKTWTLADNATPDFEVYGLKAGVFGSSYNIVIRRTPAYNTLGVDLAQDDNITWGFEAYFPTGGIGYADMAGQITLQASKHT